LRLAPLPLPRCRRRGLRGGSPEKARLTRAPGPGRRAARTL